MAGCGSGGHVSLLDLAEQEHALCRNGIVVVGGEHGDECSSNRKPGVGRRIEQLEVQIAARCETAPASEIQQVPPLVCAHAGENIGG